MQISLDKLTSKWIKENKGAGVNLAYCEKCGEYHKADFTHICRKVCGTCKFYDTNDSTSVGCRCTNPMKHNTYTSSAYRVRKTAACKRYEAME